MPRRRDSAVLGLASLALSLLMAAFGATPVGAQMRSQQAAQRVIELELPQQVIRGELEKRADFPVPLCPGSTILYTLILRNGSDPGTGVLPASIVDPIPVGTSYLAGSVTGGGVYEPDANRITWSGALGPGQSHTVTFAVTVSPFVASGDLILPLPDQIVNTATAGLGPAGGPASLPLEVTCSLVEPCRAQIRGRVEDSFGNGVRRPGDPYPISNTRVWLLSLGQQELPIAPLSERLHPPMIETITNHTEEANFGRHRFPRPEVARYAVEHTSVVNFQNGLYCPPRMAVAAFLWAADGLFAVSSQNLIDGRYVPLYLARCLSPLPSEVTGEGARCLAWKPVGPNQFLAEVDFTFGTDPTVKDSARVIGDPQRAEKPDQSEVWEPQSATPDDLMRDAAHIYFFSYKGLRYLRPLADLLGVELKPVIVAVHADYKEQYSSNKEFVDFGALFDGELHEDFGDLGERGPPSRTVGGVLIDDLGLHGRPSASDPRDGGKPDNREWHELGHYWMYEMYGDGFPPEWVVDTAECPEVVPPGLPRDGTGNHCGYGNWTTADSFVEGFAEFTSMLTSEFFGDEDASLYRVDGADEDLELDFGVWGDFIFLPNFLSLTPDDEEFAVAGILWDLHDAQSTDVKLRGTFSTQVGLEDLLTRSDDSIFQRILAQRPGTLKALHQTFNAGSVDSDGDGATNVDEIFLAHAVYDDVIVRNAVHDAGETVGLTGSSAFPARPGREDKPPKPHAYLIAHFVDDQGGAIDPEEITLEVEIEVLPPYAYYSYEFDSFPNSERIYLPLPPSYFPSVAHLRARWPAGGRVSLPFDLGSETFWQQVAAEADHVAEHTFALDQEAQCVPGPETLCLNRGRFQVEAEWATTQGTSGRGQAVSLTDDTGFFWFFHPDNVEVVLKVLEGCPVNGRFWVFAGGLTNVEVEITVTDTLTGELASYRNPQTMPFQSIQDTDAFTTCTAGQSQRSPKPSAEALAAESLDALWWKTLLGEKAPWRDAGLRPTAVTRAIPAAQNGPTTELLLNQGRFRVEATWTTVQDTSGDGRAVVLTDDTGYFWFFHPDNVEVVLKVLDACSFTGRYWVFAGGLTNVEVTITVTDTQSGDFRTYHNPLLTPFQPLQDTVAFATCP